MAAARSPSPNPSRPSNLHPTTLESSSTLRKSYTFNLHKTGSFSEISQMNAVSKSASAFSSPRASFEEKENEKEANGSKQERTRSNPSKGMKSFMAPTISASSKISSTPRKRILAERNSVVRESTESSIVSTEIMKEEEAIRKSSEIGSDSKETSAQNRSRKLDFSTSSKDHHQLVNTDSHTSDIGPSDADPSLPPYDPMKNYLSPRPQFLHYKPNPRIEQHQELKEDFLYADNVRRLEDSFSDSEDSESCDRTVEDDAVMNAKEAVLEEIHLSKSKHRSIGRPKLISFVLALIIVSFCIPLTDSPVLTALKLKDQSFARLQALSFITVLQDIHFYDYLDVAGRNLQGLSTRMRQWSKDSIEILTSLGYFSKELGMPHSLNMTISSSMVQSADLGFCYNSDLEFSEKENVVNGQIDGDGMEIEFLLDKTDAEAMTSNDIEVYEKIKVEESFNTFTSETMNKNDQSEKMLAPAISEGNAEEIYPEKLEEEVLTELAKDQSGPIIQEDVDSSAHPVVESQMSNINEYGAVLLNLLSELQLFITSEKILIFAVAGIISTASLTFLLIKKRLTTVPASDDKTTPAKTEVVDSAINSCRHANGDLCCRQRGFMEMVSDSGPTETSSSFNNNLCFSKQGKREKGYHHHQVTPSPEIMQRRDSGVSSSISYGSFTSFERRSSCRKGFSEEEVVTPVRRSSRIRNQVPST